MDDMVMYNPESLRSGSGSSVVDGIANAASMALLVSAPIHRHKHGSKWVDVLAEVCFTAVEITTISGLDGSFQRCPDRFRPCPKRVIVLQPDFQQSTASSTLTIRIS